MRLRPLGHSLSIFFVISFLLCMLWGAFTPQDLHMHRAWQELLPGFEWGSVTGIVIGLVETYLYGWYIALVFVPLYNFFNRQKTA
jgi:2TM family of unknown function (DUF5676)